MIVGPLAEASVRKGLLSRTGDVCNGSSVCVRVVRFALDVRFAAGYHCEQPAKSGCA